MTDIPNTEYLTLKKDKYRNFKILIGNKPTTIYRGQEINKMDWIEQYFNDFCGRYYPYIKELHVLSSLTCNYDGTNQIPSSHHGQYAWFRVQFRNRNITDWIFYGDCFSADLCAKICAEGCAFYVSEAPKMIELVQQYTTETKRNANRQKTL